MKVFYVEFEPSGGPPHRLAEFINYVHKTKPDHQSVILTTNSSVLLALPLPSTVKVEAWPHSADYLFPDKSKIIRSYIYIRTLFWIFLLSLKYRPDVIYCNHYQWVGYCTPIAMLLNLPQVVHLRDCWPIQMYATKRMLTIWKKTHYIAISNFVKKHFAAEYNLPTKKSVMIYDGIDSEQFTAKEVNPQQRKKIILSVSRLEPERNLEELIETACFICKENKDVVFHHYGILQSQLSSEYYEKLKKIINHAGLEKRIMFFPYSGREAIKKSFQNAYINLITSPVFALPNTAIESLLCGVPTIACEGSGNSEVIVNGKNGFLVKEPRSPFFAEAILHYLRHPKIYQKHQSSARESVIKKFDASKSYDKIYELIVKVQS